MYIYRERESRKVIDQLALMPPSVCRSCLCLLFLYLGTVRSLHDYSFADFPVVTQDVEIRAPVIVRRSSGLFVETSPGVKVTELISCTRIRVKGVSRFGNLGKYANSYHVKVQLLDKNAQKLDVCFHGNESLPFCQCAKDSWQALEKGLWSGLMSPFETKFLDLRFRDSVTDVRIMVSVDEEFWPFRVAFLSFGLILLIVAPIVSSWVPFYYSSAMVLGIFLIVIILLFQGMKLLPTGRKSTLYIVLYGSVVGMGTVILRYFSGLVSSLSKELGISNEAYNPVAIFVFLGIGLMGAWLGYWGVRKMVLSEDGTVDYGTAQFVKWAIRIVGSVMILQSSHDPILATLALLVGLLLSWTMNKVQLQDLVDAWDNFLSFWQERMYSYQSKKIMTDPRPISKAEFLPKDDTALVRSQMGSPYQRPSLSSKRFQGSPLPSMSRSNREQDYYSTFHKTLNKQQGMSRTEWTQVTEQHTKRALKELTASPKFADWFANNADRVVILPTEHREDRPPKEVQSTAYMAQADENPMNSRCWFWRF